eukprot:1481640-Heterocapsa_arctica.AAC.1
MAPPSQCPSSAIGTSPMAPPFSQCPSSAMASLGGMVGPGFLPQASPRPRASCPILSMALGALTRSLASATYM